MKDITVIIPIHELSNSEETEMFRKALDSVENNRKNYQYGELPILVACPQTLVATVSSVMSVKFKDDSLYSIFVNDGDTDYCSQINFAVSQVKTDFFSILEFDDEYTENWFDMAHEYYYTNEDVSCFLPINVQYEPKHDLWQYCNELAWASPMVKDLGYIDTETLQSCSTFNLTGGIFNTKDFITIGGYKPSIKIAFNYELLLRMLDKKLRVFVVPKEGYKHIIDRENSLTEEYLKTVDSSDVQKWFNLAKSEYTYTEDRKTEISATENEELK